MHRPDSMSTIRLRQCFCNISEIAKEKPPSYFEQFLSVAIVGTSRNASNYAQDKYFCSNKNSSMDLFSSRHRLCVKATRKVETSSDFRNRLFAI